MSKKKTFLLVIVLMSAFALALAFFDANHDYSTSSAQAEMNARAASPKFSLIDHSLHTEAAKAAARQFDLALRHESVGELGQAKAAYADLIQSNPQLLEAYINLASVHAQMGEFDKARKVLMQGIDAQENTRLLFNNLSTVQGKLAAIAYRQALRGNEKEPLPLELSEQDLQIDLASIHSLDWLSLERPQQVSSKASTQLASQLQQQAAEIETLKTALSEASDKFNNLHDRHEMEIAALQKQQTESDDTKAIAVTQSEPTMDQTLIDLQAQAQAQEQDYQRQLDELRGRVAFDDETTVDSSPEVGTESVELADSTDSAYNSKIEAFLNAWASAWSRQDVAQYVSYYAETYVPKDANLSREQWLQQRKTRLTNKKFIEVNLSDFEIQPRGDEYVATFDQRYRSDVLDDTIRKQMVLHTDGAGSYNIIEESIVSR